MSLIHTLIQPFRELIEEKIVQSLSSLGPKTHLRDACEYALKNGGKRFRPAIVFLVSEALKNGEDVSDAALAIEYFHTASLIADDLPCMDNDDKRREVPSLHKAYGEATAILASYALIAAGYDLIRKNAQRLERHAERACLLAIQTASDNMGILGATGGQYFDLFPPTINEDVVLEILHKKTATLFEISFVFGWLFGGGEADHLGMIREIAHHFGMAFQISDDFLDFEEDSKNGRKINYLAVVGREKAFEILSNEINLLKLKLKKLRIDSPELLSLISLIEKRI